jgi:hypothetical protein
MQLEENLQHFRQIDLRRIELELDNLSMSCAATAHL